MNYDSHRSWHVRYFSQVRRSVGLARASSAEPTPDHDLGFTHLWRWEISHTLRDAIRHSGRLGYLLGVSFRYFICYNYRTIKRRMKRNPQERNTSEGNQVHKSSNIHKHGSDINLCLGTMLWGVFAFLVQYILETSLGFWLVNEIQNSSVGTLCLLLDRVVGQVIIILCLWWIAFEKHGAPHGEMDECHCRCDGKNHDSHPLESLGRRHGRRSEEDSLSYSAPCVSSCPDKSRCCPKASARNEWHDPKGGTACHGNENRPACDNSHRESETVLGSVHENGADTPKRLCYPQHP